MKNVAELMSDPVEYTRRYATSVDTIAEAWQFVMGKVDEVGPRPHIEIIPVVVISMHEDEDEYRFTVVVSGMVEIPQ